MAIAFSNCNSIHQKEMMKFALFALTASVLMTTPVLADQALAGAKNCMSCHATDKKIVGPAFKEIARKYVDQKDAIDKLAIKIRKGGAGVWGSISMPANPQVNELEAKKLAAWILLN